MGDYRLITRAAELPDVARAVTASARVGLDAETTGLSFRKDRARLLQLATAAGVFVLDLFALGGAVSGLWGPLAGAELVCHNAAFDLAFLWRLGFCPGRVCDLMIMSRLLTAGTRDGNSLADLAQRHLGRSLPKELQKADWSGLLSADMFGYAARDACVTLDLYGPVMSLIQAAGLEVAADLENRAVPAFVWMSCAGAPFDAVAWGELAWVEEGRCRELTARMDAAAGRRPGFLFADHGYNWQSPQQVQEAFASAGVALASTADEALAGVDHPLATLLREHRHAAQLVKMYGQNWRDFADGGRIYANWVQLGTAAGRSSCKAPNLQQVPSRGDTRYRQCFRPPPGRVLVKADYSQLQLRIACKVAKERRMYEAYKNGEDLHTLTARNVTGKALVTKADRQLAKAVNFGLLFGLGADGFRRYALTEYGLTLTPAQAEGYRNAFFASYPGLARWHREAGRSQEGESRTILGRRRRFDAQTPFTHRLNSPVQGAEADGAKLAMALLWERRSDCPGSLPVLFIHDEIVVEADQDQSDRAAAWLRAAMLDGMCDLLRPVPCEVEVKVVPTWGG